MPDFRERFTTGSRVRVVPKVALETFKRAWRFHHPLTNQQIEFGGALAMVKEIVPYHGGDVLYVLDSVPGIWHEVCLTLAGYDDTPG
jgi:hypothetical protein